MGHYDRSRPGELPAVYQIKVKGRLDERWTDWFSGLALTVEHSSEGTQWGS